MEYKINLPTEVYFILRKIEIYGYEAVVVGGAIRNQLINQIHNKNYEIKDYDIATNAPYDRLKEIFAGFSVEEVGKQFGVLLLKMNGQHYEIAKYRVDCEYKDNRKPSNVKFTNNLKEDLARRDFTMNAIAYSLKDGIIDIFDGIKDIKNKYINFVGCREDRLDEDLLRLMRLYRFSAQYGLFFNNIGLETYSKKINNISAERIRDELNKILAVNSSLNLINVLNGMIESQLLQTIIPEFKQCIGFNQNNPYHEYILHEHLILTTTFTSNKIELRLAALLHDIGKLFCKTTDNKGISHYYGHEKISAELVIKILKRLKYNNKTIETVSKIVLNHMKLYSKPKHKGIKKIINNIGIKNTKLLIDLFKADFLSKKNNQENKKIIKEIKDIFNEIISENQPFSIKDLNINGYDLIKLGLKGKEIGEKLNILLDKVLEDQNLNKKEKLINIIKKQMEKRPTFIMMSAIPKSGKSTWVKNNYNNYSICSADIFRQNLLGEKGNMNYEKKIWTIHDNFFEDCLEKRKNIIMDNTNIKAKYRKKYLDKAKSNNYNLIGVQINTPLNVCLERAKKDNFPEEVIMRMFSNYTPLKYNEGFDIIQIINYKER